MIYIGNNELSVMLGDSEIPAIYAGDLQIYPTDFGTLTSITIENLTWVTDVSANGGTATKDNCTFKVYAHFDSGKSRNVTTRSTVTGSLVVPSTSADTREMVGVLTLTAEYETITATATVNVYQKAQTYSNIITYTTTNNQQLTLPSTTWSGNIVSHTFANNTGRIEFDDDLTAIPNDAFYYLGTLETINIPDTVTTYGARAFMNCSGMTEFHIKSGVTSIGSECFRMTSGVLTIDSQYACSGAGRTTGYNDGGNAYTYSFAGKFCGSIYKAQNYVNFDKIIITASTVTYIGSSAFHSTPVTEYVIGDYVDFFGGMAFGRLSTESSTSYPPPKPCEKFTIGSALTTIGSYVFFYSVTTSEIYYYPPTYNMSVDSNWFTVKNGTVHYRQGNTGRINGLPSGWTVVYDI